LKRRGFRGKEWGGRGKKAHRVSEKKKKVSLCGEKPHQRGGGHAVHRYEQGNSKALEEGKRRKGPPYLGDFDVLEGFGVTGGGKNTAGEGKAPNERKQQEKLESCKKGHVVKIRKSLHSKILAENRGSVERGGDYEKPRERKKDHCRKKISQKESNITTPQDGVLKATKGIQEKLS